jgi:hypothetical protein
MKELSIKFATLIRLQGIDRDFAYRFVYYIYINAYRFVYYIYILMR